MNDVTLEHSEYHDPFAEMADNDAKYILKLFLGSGFCCIFTPFLLMQCLPHEIKGWVRFAVAYGVPLIITGFIGWYKILSQYDYIKENLSDPSRRDILNRRDEIRSQLAELTRDAQWVMYPGVPRQGCEYYLKQLSNQTKATLAAETPDIVVEVTLRGGASSIYLSFLWIEAGFYKGEKNEIRFPHAYYEDDIPGVGKWHSGNGVCIYSPVFETEDAWLKGMMEIQAKRDALDQDSAQADTMSPKTGIPGDLAPTTA